MTLKVGADEPYLATSFSPIAGGGPNINPVSSYNFRTVGISVQATPRLVTEEGDILLDLIMSNDTLGPTRLVGGSPAPSFPTRSVTTKLRLRDGESHLLAGLLQDDERRSMTGVPGVMQVPILKYFFAAVRRHDRANRYRDAADAAHHPDARIQPARPQPDLRRHEPEFRADRSGAADRSAAAGRAGSRARDPACAAGTAGSAGRTEPERAADGRSGAVHDAPGDDTTAAVAAASASKPDGAGCPAAGNDGRAP